MSVHTKIGFLYLAGGSSKRMGLHKAMLRFSVSTEKTPAQTLLYRAVANVAEYSQGESAQELLLENSVFDLPSELKDSRELRQLQENFPGLHLQFAEQKNGPLHGIASAQPFLSEKNVTHVFIMACDTLLLPEELYAELSQNNTPFLTNQSSASARYFSRHSGHTGGMQSDKGRYPLFGIYPLSAFDKAKQRVSAGKLKVMDWLDALLPASDAIPLPDAFLPLISFNSQAEFEAAKDNYAKYHA